MLYVERWATMRCVVSTGVPRRDQHSDPTAAASDERPRQGRRNPRATAPDHGARTAPARRPGPVHPSGSGLARGPAAPATANRAQPAAAAGAPGDRTALAPRSDRPPACQEFPAPPGRTATNDPVNPPAGPAPSLGEQHLGIPPYPRRTTRPGRQGRRLHRLGDPERGRCRSGTSAHQQHMGDVPTLPSPRHHRRRLFRNRDADRCTPLRPGRHRTRHPPHPESSVPQRTRPQPG